MAHGNHRWLLHGTGILSKTVRGSVHGRIILVGLFVLCADRCVRQRQCSSAHGGARTVTDQRIQTVRCLSGWVSGCVEEMVVGLRSEPWRRSSYRCSRQRWSLLRSWVKWRDPHGRRGRPAAASAPWPNGSNRTVEVEWRWQRPVTPACQVHPCLLVRVHSLHPRETVHDNINCYVTTIKSCIYRCNFSFIIVCPRSFLQYVGWKSVSRRVVYVGPMRIAHHMWVGSHVPDSLDHFCRWCSHRLYIRTGQRLQQLPVKPQMKWCCWFGKLSSL